MLSPVAENTDPLIRILGDILFCEKNSSVKTDLEQQKSRAQNQKVVQHGAKIEKFRHEKAYITEIPLQNPKVCGIITLGRR